MQTFTAFLKRILQQEDGQSMVEFVVCAPVLVLVLYTLFYLSDLYIVKSKALIGARVAAWQVARATHNASAAQAGVVENFHFRFGGRDPRAHVSSLMSAPESGSIEVGIAPHQSTGVSLGGLNDLVAAGLGALLGDDNSSQTTHSTLVYQLPVRMGPLDLSEFAGEGAFSITAHHYVDGNSWNGCAVEVHDLIENFRDRIAGIFDFI